ncbi:non-symbiotic hemoglobin 2 [Senna tora]|uniref:Non-symbiotic hemoglobin 2 n=1 Tax=Senna tora TaxID=362788 RepID=A0A834T0R7_9FABA|nr:non-symbiotic hemoglobin 2 [Senna tora]
MAYYFSEKEEGLVRSSWKELKQDIPHHSLRFFTLEKEEGLVRSSWKELKQDIPHHSLRFFTLQRYVLFSEGLRGNSRE